MVNRKCLHSLILCLGFIFNLSSPMAAEYSFHGVADIRVSATDSLDKNYFSAGQGKFSSSEGEQVSLAQAGAELSVEWDNGLSGHSIINGYASSEESNENVIGFTENYLKYRSLPN